MAIVALAVLLVVTPGLVVAKGGMGPGHGQGTTVFALQGCITNIDYDAYTFEVEIVKSKKGVELPDMPIYTDGTTRILEWEDGEQSLIPFDYLAVNDPVSVNGHIVNDQLWATQVTVNPDCPVLEGACE